MNLAEKQTTNETGKQFIQTKIYSTTLSCSSQQNNQTMVENNITEIHDWSMKGINEKLNATFIADSGATEHMTKSREIVKEYNDRVKNIPS